MSVGARARAEVPTWLSAHYALVDAARLDEYIGDGFTTPVVVIIDRRDGLIESQRVFIDRTSFRH